MMLFPDKQKLELFSFRLSLATGALVAFLGILKGVNLMLVVLRSIVSMAVIYLLCQGCFFLWEMISPPEKYPDTDKKSTLDVLLGADTNEGKDDLKGDNAKGEKPVPGQINLEVKDGRPDAKNQAEIVKKMGWGDEQ